ncbi:hypothetical protein ACWN8P_12440 [Vagococcus salmoninarum]|uniref:Uncharacterized protein n=1 Tax=Vagococcus salmoninarum TaxID=2739 RepID=A0A429ZSF8_9ENTE|nr:hypothetical protein [Vagococcus salmoninarum]RST96674.1 hypothetical protein CBF35_05425 [Vagococcus salmoninarum]
MTLLEFIEYMESVMSSKETFYSISMDDQLARNSRRKPAKRWNEEKIERAIDMQWKELMTNVYEKVKAEKGNSLKSAWIEFIMADDFLEQLDGSIAEIEFD